MTATRMTAGIHAWPVIAGSRQVIAFEMALQEEES
jgi:hypothetical protein